MRFDTPTAVHAPTPALPRAREREYSDQAFGVTGIGCFGMLLELVD